MKPHFRWAGRWAMLAGFALLGAFAWWRAGRFAIGGESGPALVPRLAAGGIVALALLGFFTRRPAPAVTHGAGEEPDRRRLLKILGLVALYAVTFPLLGFVVATALLAAALVAVGADRRVDLRLVIAEELFVAAAYLVFTYVFQIQFPTGILR